MHPDATTPQDLYPEPRVEGPVKIFWHSIPPGPHSHYLNDSLTRTLVLWICVHFPTLSGPNPNYGSVNQPLHIYACAAKQGWNPPKIPLGALIQLLDLISVRFFKSSILRWTLYAHFLPGTSYRHCLLKQHVHSLCLLPANFILSTQLENCCHQERINYVSFPPLPALP